MTLGERRRIHRAEPFQPFTLCVADGREIPVKHAEFLATLPRRSVIITQHSGAFDIIDLMLVTGIHINGGTKRKTRKQK